MKRELIYIKENFGIMVKSLIEYKSNFYASFFEQFSYYLTLGLFLFVILTNFSDVISWTLKEFIFYLVFFDFLLILVNIFFWSKEITLDIPKGDLNQYINRPLNRIVSYQCSRLSPETLPQVFFSFLILILLLLYYNIGFIHSLLSFGILLLLSLSYFAFKMFISSFTFYSIGFTKYLYKFENNFYFIMQQYPTPFFSSSKLIYILMFYPFIFIGSLLIPFISGLEIWRVELQFIVLLALTIFFFIIALINWHYGLKKYEAFG